MQALSDSAFNAHPNLLALHDVSRERAPAIHPSFPKKQTQEKRKKRLQAIAECNTCIGGVNVRLEVLQLSQDCGRELSVYGCPLKREPKSMQYGKTYSCRKTTEKETP